MRIDKIGYDKLLAYVIKILEKLGYSLEQAEVTARVLVEADARGVPSHGTARLTFYESHIKRGMAFLKRSRRSFMRRLCLSLSTAQRHRPVYRQIHDDSRY